MYSEAYGMAVLYHNKQENHLKGMTLNVQFAYKRQNTGVWLFIRRVSGVYRSAFSYVFTWQLHV